MTNPSKATPVYEIRLQGYLDPRWSRRLDGFEIRYLDGGDTLLVGVVVDQAALHGILSQIRDIGIPLIDVRCLNPGEPG